MVNNYLGVKEVAELLHIGYNKARKLFHQKGFPGIKLGGTYVVDEKDLSEYLERHKGSQIAI